MTIIKRGNESLAEVAGEGFQTHFRIRAKVQKGANSVRIIYLGQIEEGLQKFKPGDTLFELVQAKEKVITKWVVLTPAASVADGFIRQND